MKSSTASTTSGTLLTRASSKVRISLVSIKTRILSMGSKSRTTSPDSSETNSLNDETSLEDASASVSVDDYDFDQEELDAWHRRRRDDHAADLMAEMGMPYIKRGGVVYKYHERHGYRPVKKAGGFSRAVRSFLGPPQTKIHCFTGAEFAARYAPDQKQNKRRFVPVMVHLQPGKKQALRTLAAYGNGRHRPY